MARVKSLQPQSGNQSTTVQPSDVPTGEQLASGIQKKYEKDVQPALVAAENWRQRSRDADWVVSVH